MTVTLEQLLFNHNFVRPEHVLVGTQISQISLGRLPSECVWRHFLKPISSNVESTPYRSRHNTNILPKRSSETNGIPCRFLDHSICSKSLFWVQVHIIKYDCLIHPKLNKRKKLSGWFNLEPAVSTSVSHILLKRLNKSHPRSGMKLLTHFQYPLLSFASDENFQKNVRIKFSSTALIWNFHIGSIAFLLSSFLILFTKLLISDLKYHIIASVFHRLVK